MTYEDGLDFMNQFNYTYSYNDRRRLDEKRDLDIYDMEYEDLVCLDTGVCQGYFGTGSCPFSRALEFEVYDEDVVEIWLGSNTLPDHCFHVKYPVQEHGIYMYLNWNPDVTAKSSKYALTQKQVDDDVCNFDQFDLQPFVDSTLYSLYIDPTDTEIYLGNYVGISTTGVLLGIAIDGDTNKDPLYPLSIEVDQCLGSVRNHLYTYYYTMASPCQWNPVLKFREKILPCS